MDETGGKGVNQNCVEDKSSKDLKDLNDPKVKLAEDLFSIYRRDHATGILDARLKWKEFDEDFLLITKGWANSAKLELDEVESITSLGIDGYEWAFFVEAHNTVSFYNMLNTIVEYSGQPPAGEPLRRHALDILSGRMNLQGAIRLVAADTPLLTALPQVFQSLLPGIDPQSCSTLEQAVRVAAAAALRWEDLLRLRGLAPRKGRGEEKGAGDGTGDGTGDGSLNSGYGCGDEGAGDDEELLEALRDDYRTLMEKIDDPKLLEDPRREEDLLLKALDVAVQSPEPDDDIETIKKIVQLGDRFELSVYSVRRCVDAIHKLVTRGHHGVDVARSVVALVPLIAGHNIKREMSMFINQATELLLKTPLPKELRQDLTTVAVRAHLWRGDSKKADEVLAAALDQDSYDAGPLRSIELALLKANILIQEKDDFGASEVLLEALDRKSPLDGRARLPLLRTLLSNWPKKRGVQEIRPRVLEVIKVTRNIPEPKRTLILVKLTLRLHSRGQREASMSLWGHVDYEKIRYTVPLPLAEKVYKIIERAADKLGYSMASQGFEGKTVKKKIELDRL